uniref:2OGFeDO JBP1/TET oxygenase domain-containing protein n=1 Tax=viral metagenome TaxID=1070528 RepID=A0A6C0HT44_9ZZZZ
MTIIKKEKKGNITTFIVEKDFDDEKMESKMNKLIKPKDIKTIIDYDADVYTNEGKLLLRFRKNVLDTQNVDAFYDNIIQFAKNVSALRGRSSGSKSETSFSDKKVMSNIFGYFDSWSPAQKIIFKARGITPSLMVRQCRFNMDNPEKYKKTIPLIKDIDNLYAKLTPEQYKLQRRKANQTYFKIPGTSFTTVTTNINYQTSTHKDKGDDEEGFGNLAVIERGEYTGAETCFPQYGIGVNVRSGDILFMDVHQPHANLPMHKKEKDAIRLSIVCYLRKNVWLRSKNKTRRFYESHNKTVKNLRSSKVK